MLRLSYGYDLHFVNQDGQRDNGRMRLTVMFDPDDQRAVLNCHHGDMALITADNFQHQRIPAGAWSGGIGGKAIGFMGGMAGMGGGLLKSNGFDAAAFGG